MGIALISPFEIVRVFLNDTPMHPAAEDDK